MKIGIIQLYDSIDNMPQLRKHLFDRFILMELGIGGSIEGIEQSFQKLDHFIAAKDFEKLLIERQNLHFKFINSLSTINFKSLAFVCLVFKYGDEDVEVTDDSSAEEWQEKILKEVSNKELNDFIEEVKKNYLKSLGYTILSSTKDTTS